MSILTPRRRLVMCTLITAAAITPALGAPAAADVPSGLSLNTAAHVALRRDVTATIKGAPVLGGFTSQGGPIVLALSRDTKRLQRAEIALVMRCTSGGRFVFPGEFFGLAVRPNGRVHFTVSTAGRDGSGDSVKVSQSFGATINRKRWTASGAWQAHVNVTTPSGQTDSCDSGNASFHAQL